MMTMSWMFSLLTMIPFTVLRRAMRQDYYWYHLVPHDKLIFDRHLFKICQLRRMSPRLDRKNFAASSRARS